MRRNLAFLTCITWFLCLVTVRHAHASSLETIGSMPEIVVTAPQYTGEEADSIGLMPGIVVFAERYMPKTENTLIQAYKNFSDSYQSLAQYLYKYALFVVVTVFILSWSIIAFVKKPRQLANEAYERKTKDSRSTTCYEIDRQNQVT